MLANGPLQHHAIHKLRILGSWYHASRINIKQTNTVQLGSDLYYCTS